MRIGDGQLKSCFTCAYILEPICLCRLETGAGRQTSCFETTIGVHRHGLYGPNSGLWVRHIEVAHQVVLKDHIAVRRDDRPISELSAKLFYFRFSSGERGEIKMRKNKKEMLPTFSESFAGLENHSLAILPPATSSFHSSVFLGTSPFGAFSRSTRLNSAASWRLDEGEWETIKVTDL